MQLKELLKSDFGLELPISGGFGNSIANPITIHRTSLNDYVGTERTILNCLGKGRNIKWNQIGQELLTHDNRKIDKIKIETISTNEYEIVTQVENYYFDITDCYGAKNCKENSFNEKITVENIKHRLVELEGLNDFNKKCINLLKKEQLFKDTK